MDLFEQTTYKRDTFETLEEFAYGLGIGVRQYQRFTVGFVRCSHALWLCGNSVDMF